MLSCYLITSVYKWHQILDWALQDLDSDASYTLARGAILATPFAVVFFGFLIGTNTLCTEIWFSWLLLLRHLHLPVLKRQQTAPEHKCLPEENMKSVLSGRASSVSNVTPLVISSCIVLLCQYFFVPPEKRDRAQRINIRNCMLSKRVIKSLPSMLLRMLCRSVKACSVISKEQEMLWCNDSLVFEG